MRLEAVADGLELVESLAAHGARLRVGDLLLGLVQSGHQLGEEGRGILGILDELGHVVDDHGAHALGGGGPDAEAEEEERRDEREGRGGHGLHKGGGRELLDALHDELVVDGGGDERGDEGLDVAVIDGVADVLEALPGRDGDLLLGVVHHLRHDGDDVVERLGDGQRGGEREGADSVERADHGLPLLLGVHGLEHGGENRAHAVAGHGLGEHAERGGGGFLHLLAVLVRAAGDEGGDQGDHLVLGALLGGTRDGRNGHAGALALGGGALGSVRESPRERGEIGGAQTRARGLDLLGNLRRGGPARVAAFEDRRAQYGHYGWGCFERGLEKPECSWNERGIGRLATGA